MEAKDVLDDKLEALKFTTNENLISLSVIVITLFFPFSIHNGISYS